MRGTTFELMQDHVRAIHRALTGKDPPEPVATPVTPPTQDEVVEHFTALEALANSIPTIAERVPPFSFSPPLDVSGTDQELILELGVPGVERDDVIVEFEGDTVVVSGARSTASALDGRLYFHAELPRGPFRRVVRLPQSTSGPARVEVAQGIVRVRLTKATKSPLPRA